MFKKPTKVEEKSKIELPDSGVLFHQRLKKITSTPLKSYSMEKIRKLKRLDRVKDSSYFLELKQLHKISTLETLQNIKNNSYRILSSMLKERLKDRKNPKVYLNYDFTIPSQINSRFYSRLKDKETREKRDKLVLGDSSLLTVDRKKARLFDHIRGMKQRRKKAKDSNNCSILL